MSNDTQPGILATKTRNHRTSKIWIFEVGHDTLVEHLTNIQHQQSTLDEYLWLVFQFAQSHHTDMSDLAPVLTLLLRSGAKWRQGASLKHGMTPYHIICQSTGDHDKLLDLTIKMCGQALVNTKSNGRSTALLCAVRSANLNCVRCLIANGADVIGAERCWPKSLDYSFDPLIETIRRLQPGSKYPPGIMTDVFDILLDNIIEMNIEYEGFYHSSITYAINLGNVECLKKLIRKGAELETYNYKRGYVWCVIAKMGNVELLNCMFNVGIDMNWKHRNGETLLSHVVHSKNIDAIRYLLDIGVSVNTYTPTLNKVPCMDCGKKILIIDAVSEERRHEPYMIACELNMLPVVKLLEEYGCKNFKSIDALRYAMTHNSVEVVHYLLEKYTYPLNVEYTTGRSSHHNLLDEVCGYVKDNMVHLLLDHGADPNVKICKKKSLINKAMDHRHIGVVARIIRGGGDVNNRFPSCLSDMIPFEAFAFDGNVHAAEMLLVVGCSCGMFSLPTYDQENLAYVDPKLMNLMKKWHVHENNVTPLRMQCRRAILSQLCPQAEKKIKSLPLPPSLIKYLSIPELDDIMKQYRRSRGK